MVISSKRPKNLALFSFIVSVFFFGIAFFLGQWSGFLAISAVSWFILYVALICFVLCIQFYQRALAEQEKLDLSQLAKAEQSSTIFQAKSEHENLFSVARGRLEILEKWFIPIFSTLIAIYQIVVGFLLIKTALSGTEKPPQQPLFCSIILTAIAFVSFLVSRYATGMSSQKHWKPLRAGGSSMLGAALLCFALAIMLALVYLFPDYMISVLNILAIIIPGLMILIGIEIALNLIMDIYRPRLKGQYSRSAFDSRILGTINQSGGILRSAADALDYQFGFQVSQTWFYKLLEQAVIPLILFGAVALYLLSCIVIVNPDEQAIIEYFGNPVNDSNDVRFVEPGLAFKWPWPIEKAYIRPVKRISEISIGYVEGDSQEEPTAKLWGRKHYEQEYHLLVASRQEEEDFNDTSIPPVNLVIAAVPVQYRINDLYSFIYKHDEPEKVLESICYRELTKYAVSAKLEESEESDAEQSLLGKGRIEASKVLSERIQKAADLEGLGIEIVFLGLQGVHPPMEVAKDYQNVTGAIQEKQRKILAAQARKIRTLSVAAGSVAKAQELSDLDDMLKNEKQKAEPDPVKIQELTEQLDEAFEQAKGNTYKILIEAQTYAFNKKVLAEADGKRFAGQIQAYNAAPQIYLYEQWISMLEDTLEDIRKYVIVAEKEGKQITIIDLEDKLESSLMEGVLETLQESRGQ